MLVSIDLGTSAVKVAVYNLDGSLLELNKHPIQRQDPEEWIHAIEKAIPRVLKRGTDQEVFVTVDSTSGSFLMVDEYGNPLTKPSMYYEKDIEAYNLIKEKEAIKELSQRGVIIDPSSPLTRLYGIKKRFPNLYAKTKWIVPVTTWLLYRLCIREGEKWINIKTDFTNALKFGLDILKETPRYFTRVYDELELDINKMPDLAPSGEFICKAKSRWSERIGLYNSGVYQGMTDGVASALASGVLELGSVSVYSGSTTVIKMATKKLITHPSVYWHLHPLGGYLASVTTGFTGFYLSWMCELFSIEMNKVDQLVENIKIGDEFLFIPPGDRAPFYDPSINASILGLKISENETREYTIGRFLRGFMIGLSLAENYLIHLLEKLSEVKAVEIGLSGGGVKSKVHNILRASIYRRTVKIYPDVINTGPLVPVLLKTHLYSNLNAIKEKFIKPIETIRPDPSLQEAYSKLREKYSNIWSMLKEIYNNLQ